MKTDFLLVLFFAVLISLSCSPRNDVSNRFGGGENIVAIAKPDSVKAWRTVGSLNPSESFSFTNFYQKAGVATLVSTNLADQLGKILLNEKSYLNLHGLERDCTILPSVIINFHNAKTNLDVFLCFNCDTMIVRAETDEKEESIEFSSYFDPSRPELVRIMKSIFPNDSQIQSLKEKR